jgi:hypothetical protein
MLAAERFPGDPYGARAGASPGAFGWENSSLWYKSLLWSECTVDKRHGTPLTCMDTQDHQEYDLAFSVSPSQKWIQAGIALSCQILEVPALRMISLAKAASIACNSV